MKKLLFLCFVFCVFEITFASIIIDVGHIGIVSLEGKVIYENPKMRLVETNNDLERYDDLIPIKILREKSRYYDQLGYISYSGKLVFNDTIEYNGKIYSIARNQPFYDKYAIVTIKDNDIEKYFDGVIDINGNWVINPEYETIYMILMNGESSYALLTGPISNIEWKYYTSLSLKWKLQNWNSDYWEENDAKIIRINKNNKSYFGMMNLQGKILLEPIYDYIGSATCGLFIIKKDLKCGFIDNKGSIIIPIEYDYVLPYIDGVTKVSKANEDFIINRNNKIIYKYKMDRDLNRFSVYNNQIIVYEKHNDKTYAGLLTTDGEWIIKPDKYQYITFFNEGYAIVCNENGKYIINRELKIVNDITHIKGYPHIMGFNNGYCIFKIFIKDYDLYKGSNGN